MSLPYTGQALIDRVREQDTYAVKLFLAAGMKPDVLDNDGKTPLMHAVSTGNMENIEALLGAKANISRKDYYNWTALTHAVRSGSIEALQQLLKHEPGDAIVKEAYLAAAKAGKVEAFKVLAKHGVADSSSGSQALLAAASSHVASADEQALNEIVKILLDQKVDIETKDDTGLTLMMLACTSGRTTIVQTLLDRGAAVNSQCECPNYINGGWTALLIAVNQEKKRIVNQLLDRGADVNSKNAMGDAAVHIAAKRGTQDVLTALLSKGADVNMRNAQGMTALMVAAQEGKPEAARVLIERGAAVKEQDSRQKSALEYALARGNKDTQGIQIVQMLTAAGAEKP
ncbi:MAG: ankyrin repeat domain-containing protein [Nitrospirota bacterium]